jgi:hypothetical protein
MRRRRVSHVLPEATIPHRDKVVSHVLLVPIKLSQDRPAAPTVQLALPTPTPDRHRSMLAPTVLPVRFKHCRDRRIAWFARLAPSTQTSASPVARLVLWGRMATRLALAVWCRAWTVLLECMVRWRVWRSAWRVMLASMRPSLPCRSVCRARRVAIRQQWVRPARPCVCCVLREHSAMSWAPRTNPCVRIAVWVRTMRRRVRRHVQVARTEPLRTWRAGWCAWDAWRVASVRWWVRQHRRCARCARRGSMDRWGVWRRA